MFFLSTVPFIFPVEPLGPETRLPSAPQNSAVVLIMMRAKKSEQTQLSITGRGSKVTKKGLGTVMILIREKKKKNRKHLRMARHPSPPLGFLFFPSCLRRLIILLIPCPLYLSAERCSGGERQMLRFSA